MSDAIAAAGALSEASGWFDSDARRVNKKRLSDYEGGDDDIWFAAVNEK